MKQTSHLLINEYPLILLPSLAIALGLNEAIVLQQIKYWLTKSTNIRDGRPWVYKTYKEWEEEFSFWSLATIGRTIRKLEELGILLSTDKYNQSTSDRTKWYTIDYDVLNSKMPSRGSQVDTLEDVNLTHSGGSQVDTLLPETTTETTTETLMTDHSWIFDQYLSVFMEPVSSAEHDDLNELAEVFARPDISDVMRITKSANARRRISRKVAYMRGILQDWAANGKPVIVPGNGSQQQQNKPMRPRKVFR